MNSHLNVKYPDATILLFVLASIFFSTMTLASECPEEYFDVCPNATPRNGLSFFLLPNTTVEHAVELLGKPDVSRLKVDKDSQHEVLILNWYTTSENRISRSLDLIFSAGNLKAINVFGIETAEFLKDKGVVLQYSDLLGKNISYVKSNFRKSPVNERLGYVEYKFDGIDLEFRCTNKNEVCQDMYLFYR